MQKPDTHETRPSTILGNGSRLMAVRTGTRVDVSLYCVITNPPGDLTP